MPTQRKQTKATGRLGVNYTRSLVEKHNCIFQEIDLENDVGNDAYIEFIRSESATGCCIGVQVKSGSSYIRQSDGMFLLKSDKEHFEYWSSHLLPIAGVVYDPDLQIAVWCDITEHLNSHPDVVNDGPFQIEVSRDQILDDTTFGDFAAHFLRYQAEYSQDANFGRALELLAHMDDVESSQDALQSLFSFHRQRQATWFYFIYTFRFFANHSALPQLIYYLSLLPGHGDIYWHKKNTFDEGIRTQALRHMRRCFGESEIKLLLSAIDDAGIDRGTIGQAIYALVDSIDDKEISLEKIAFDGQVDGQVRFWALLILAASVQYRSINQADSLIKRYMQSFPQEEEEERLGWIVETFDQGERIHIY